MSRRDRLTIVLATIVGWDVVTITTAAIQHGWSINDVLVILTATDGPLVVLLYLMAWPYIRRPL